MYDLSIVTDTLRAVLVDALAASPVWGGGGPPFSVSVSGQHPAELVPDTDCDLNLYLFHVAEDKFVRNSFWTQQNQSGGPGGQQPVAFEPLALDLWYILSAQARTSYTQEQQVLGVAMRAFHEHGTVNLATPTPPPDSVAPSQISLVMESPGFDELSRLWQALGNAMRTTAQYRVSVVFMTPEDPLPPQPKVTAIGLSSPPTAAGDPAAPALFGTSRHLSYIAPGPKTVIADQDPATSAPAPAAASTQQFVLRGRGLLASDDVILIETAADGTETLTDINAWKVPLDHPYPSPPADGVPFVLQPPEATTNSPGRYQLAVTRASLPGWRSAAVPFALAAWVDPTGGPTIDPVAGVFTCPVRNLTPDGASVRLGTVALENTGGAPAAGQWSVSGTTLRFVAPDGLAAAVYPLRVRVNEVESDPALWAVVA